jgi:cytochrome P450
MSSSATRVMEYDPFSQEFQADPFPVYRWMRDEAPVFYSEKWNWWALSRFEDVRAAATDPRTFLSFEGIDIDDTAKDQSGPGFLPDIDNPRHDQIRRMIQPQLLPNRIAEREDAIRAVVRGLIDAWRNRGTVDDAQRGVLRPARPARGPGARPRAAQPVGARAQGPQARRIPAYPGGQGCHRGHPELLHRPAA